MGIRVHDTDDNLEGISKEVQEIVKKGMRTEAQRQKEIDLTHPLTKRGKYLGNGKTP
jgi:hypothetical protein